MNSALQYLLNTALMLDRIGNTIVGGSSRETISSRLGRAELHYGGIDKMPWWRPGKYIAMGLDAVWKEHCHNAIQWEDMSQILQETLIDRYYLDKRDDDDYHTGKP